MIHPILGEVTKNGRLNSPGYMLVSFVYRGSPNGWLSKCLTSGRLILVEVRLRPSIRTCQSMAGSAFLSFLHVLMLKILKQNVLLFCFLMSILNQETPEWPFALGCQGKERRKRKTSLPTVNFDRQQGIWKKK